MFRRNFIQSVLSVIPAFWLTKSQTLTDQKIEFGDRVRSKIGDRSVGVVCNIRKADPREAGLDFWDKFSPNWRNEDIVWVNFNGLKTIMRKDEGHPFDFKMGAYSYPVSLLTKVPNDTPFT